MDLRVLLFLHLFFRSVSGVQIRKLYLWRSKLVRQSCFLLLVTSFLYDNVLLLVLFDVRLSFLRLIIFLSLRDMVITKMNGGCVYD